MDGKLIRKAILTLFLLPAFGQILGPILFRTTQPTSVIPTSGLLLWWDAGFGANCSGATCTNGASQNTWADRSGHGNTGILNGVVTSTCIASVFNTAQINGQPALTFIGNNSVGSDTCFGLTGSGLTNTSTTMFVVAKVASTAAVNTIVSGSNGAFDWRANTTKMQEANKACVSSLGTSTSAVNTSWHQLNVTYNGTAINFRTDRAADGSASPGVAITSTFRGIGINPCGGGLEAYNGQIAEYILYNRVLSGGEITTVETYLNGKYGL